MSEEKELEVLEAANQEASEQSAEQSKEDRPRRGTNRPRRERPVEESPYQEQLISIGRITKVVKGGRRLRFNALVVIGDGKGLVGFGTGKAHEVPDAIKKAAKDAEKNLIKVPLYGATIPHTQNGHYGAGAVIIKPAVPGTGISAGGAARGRRTHHHRDCAALRQSRRHHYERHPQTDRHRGRPTAPDSSER